MLKISSRWSAAGVRRLKGIIIVKDREGLTALEECRTDGLESLSQANAERSDDGPEQGGGSQHQSWKQENIRKFRTGSICSLMRPVRRRSELS